MEFSEFNFFLFKEFGKRWKQLNTPFELEVFQGPLDLLLYLIHKNEINIYDIPIATITQQYLDHLELMQELNLNVAGEFILMAVQLIEMKIRMILPKPPSKKEWRMKIFAGRWLNSSLSINKIKMAAHIQRKGRRF